MAVTTKTIVEILRTNVNSEKNVFKRKAYLKVIGQLEAEEYVNKKIKSIEDLSEIKGIGVSIKKLITDILNGDVKIDLEQKAKDEAIQNFMDIMSVGAVKATSLVNEHNILTIKELKNNLHLLNNKQITGLKYYEDFKKKIPRDEMKVHHAVLEKALKGIDKDIIFDIVGSYRRGKSSSGDIDVLISHPNGKNMLPQIIEELKRQEYILDDFAFGTQKYMGVSKVCSTFRRIDILFITPSEYPFALLYFTGSKTFNIKMRRIALDKGYTLNEHGIKIVVTNEKVKKQFKSEHDIFKLLSMPYTDPLDR